MNLIEIWNGITTLLKEEISQTALDTWFSSAELVDLDNTTAVICAGNTLAKDIILKRFEAPLKKVLRELFCQDFQLIVLCGNEEKRDYIAKKEGREGFKALTIPAYSFNQYVVGASNKFAYMVSKAISENPDDKDYNPVFIYGPAGTGKTHLLCSIALSIHDKFPGKKIEYISGDEFTNQLVAAIKDHKTDKFRDKFRSVDVLLIDNVQFIVGKPATQEEFYNTFNHLYESGKLIVMASDMAPREMPVLESRMLTRFESGIMADIKTPEESLRCEVISRKSRDLSLDMSQEDISYMASKPIRSVRQIEGMLKSLSAQRKLFGYINRSCIDDVLSRSLFESDNRISAEDIVNECAKYFEVSESEIKGRSRARNISNARQIAMYLMRMDLGMTLEDIGEYLSRDHATVISAVNKISNLSHTDENILKAINSIKKKINGRVA